MQNYKTFSLAAVLALVATPMLAQNSDAPKAGMIVGPGTAILEGIAEVQVPANFVFFDGPTTRKRLKSQGQPVSGHELGFLKPMEGDWAVMFEFDPSGYVKDDDKDKLNADKLLASIREGNDAANRERKSMGSPIIQLVGWEQPPHYDDTTHNLEWAVRGTVEGEAIINYNTRLLGRKGVMEVVLIVEPKDLQSTLPQFKNLLTNYKFATGQSYAEYRPGDKVAKYGLAALITAGAAVGAAKLGLFAWLAVVFKKFFKLIIVAVVAVLAMFKKVIGRLFGRSDSSTT